MDATETLVIKANLATVYQRMKNYQESVGLFEQAIEEMKTQFGQSDS